MAPANPTPDDASLLGQTAKLGGPDPSTAASKGLSFPEAGRYGVLSKLGEGGMGEVYLCWDSQLRRKVAIKLLTEMTEEFIQRFEEEAQITGQLEHPNIIPIHEYGVDLRGQPYFVMKRVKGQSLDELVSQRSRSELLQIMLKICDAVSFAHSREVIHRDLKPENVMVGSFGEVLVMDWGLWRMMEAPGSSERHGAGVDPPSDAIAVLTPAGGPHQTQLGLILGTPEYMAPEQAVGENHKIDARTDIYSLGAMLYEFLTGQVPHRGETVVELIACAIGGTFEPPDRAAPERGIPPELSAITMKAMMPKRAQRYQTVADFRLDLERYLDGHSVSARRDPLGDRIVKWVKRHPVSVAVGVTAVLVALAGTGGVMFTQHRGQVLRIRTLGNEARAAQAAGQTLENQLQALTAVNRWLEAAAAAPEAIEAKAQVLTRINTLGVKSKDWEMARHAAREVGRLAGYAEKGKKLLAETDAAATRRSRENQQRLTQIFGQVRRGEVASQQMEAHLLEIIGMRDPQAVDAAITALGSKNALSRRLAARVLGWLGAKKAVTPLIDNLSDPELENAITVAQALGRIGDPRAEAPLAGELFRRGGPTSLFGLRTRMAFLGLKADARVVARPEDPQGYLERARSALRRQEPKKALADARRARALDPKNLEAYMLEGNALRHLGRSAEAVAVYRLGLVHAPRQPELWFNVGTALADQRKFAESLKAYDRAISLSTQEAVFFLNRGYTLLELGRPADAAKDLRKALQLNPSNSRALAVLGTTLFKLGRRDEALRLLEKAHKLHPEDAKTLANLGDVLRKLGRLDEAISRLSQGIDREPTFWLLYCYRAMCHQDRLDWKTSLPDANRAVEPNPRNPRCWLVRSITRGQLGWWSEAHADVLEGLKRSPNWTALRLQLARCLVGLKRLKEAERELRDGFAKTRGPLFLYEIAQLCEARRDLTGAERAYTDAIKVSPRFADAYGMRARVRSMLGLRQQALADYDKAIDELGVDFYTYLANRGMLKLELKRPMAAEKDFRLSLSKRRTYDFGQYGLGLSLIQQGKTKEGRAVLEGLLVEQPKSRWARAAEKALAGG